MAVYYVKTSSVGRNKITAFATGGPAVDIATFAVGDSNGVYYEPTGEEAALVHQVWSGNVNRVYAHPNHANWIVVEALIPASQGGFDIREALVKDATGAVIAIGKYPLTNKPAPGSGAEKDLYVRMIMSVTDAAAVNQTIDPSLIMATQEYVDTRMPHRVRVVATANVALAGLQIIDTVQLVDNDRVLLSGQGNPVENGIYIAHAGAWVRALDADSDLDMLASLLAIVSEGNVNGDTVWMLTTNAPITVGTTGLTFTRIYPDESARTIADSLVPTGNTAGPSTLFSWLGYIIKAITGKANWYTSPATTLEVANTHIQASAPHTGHVNHALATALDDMLMATGPGTFVKKTIAEVKARFGFGDAAYKNTGTAAGQVAAGDHAHSVVATETGITAATTGSAFPVGVTWSKIYNNGFPCAYGNAMTIRGLGMTQYAFEWSGVTGASGNIWFRNARDSTLDTWSGWRQIATLDQLPASLPANGGNADTLDGLHAAAFAAYGHNHAGTYEPANGNVQGHIGTVGNPHGTTAAQTGAAAWNHGHGNDGGIGGPYMTTARFQWSGQPGQPTWLWGSNDGQTMYVWDPRNFSVAYATNAGNANTLAGYGIGSFLLNNGFNASANGYARIGAFIIQWGTGVAQSAEGPQTLTFPIVFPNACLWAGITTWSNGTIYDDGLFQDRGASTASVVAYLQAMGGNVPLLIPRFIAIGW
jgi:hypothetical protein